MNKLLMFSLGLLISISIGILHTNNTYAQSTPQNFGLTFEVRDATGNLLPGATFEGLTCIKWDNDPLWQCQDLNEYVWFSQGLPETGTTGDSFWNDIQMRGNASSMCLEDPEINSQHMVLIKQKTAPAGYTITDGWLATCMNKDGWIPGDEVISEAEKAIQVFYGTSEPVAVYPMQISPNPNGSTFSFTQPAPAATDQSPEPQEPTAPQPTLADTGVSQTATLVAGALGILIASSILFRRQRANL